MLQVNIEYYNNQEVFNFDPNRVQYRYTVDHVKESEFKAYEIIPVAGDGGQRIENNRHGIRIVFRQIGMFVSCGLTSGSLSISVRVICFGILN